MNLYHSFLNSLHYLQHTSALLDAEKAILARARVMLLVVVEGAPVDTLHGVLGFDAGVFCIAVLFAEFTVDYASVWQAA